MAIRTLEDGKRYQFRVELKSPDGTFKEHTRVFKGGKRAAERAYHLFVAELESSQKGLQSGTVAWICEMYLNQMLKQGRSPGYEKQLRLYCSVAQQIIGDVTLSNCGTSVVEGFYQALASRNLTPNTISHYHSFLRPALQLAVDQGFLQSNPALRAKRPKVLAPELSIPTWKEIQHLLECAFQSEPWTVYVYLTAIVATSARRAEICALRWSDVDFEKKRILIQHSYDGSRIKDTKTHGKRSLTLLDDDFTNLLLQHREFQITEAQRLSYHVVDNAFLFSFAVSGQVPPHPDSMSKAFARVRKAADLPGVRLHDLRHFGATEALAAGMPINMVSYRLGHQKMSTTLDMYGHHRPDLDIHMAKFMGENIKLPTKRVDE